MEYRLKQKGSEVQELLNKIEPLESKIEPLESKIEPLELKVRSLDSKIADPFTGVLCLKLGKSGALTEEEVAAIREKLAYMLDSEKFYLVSVYDNVDKQFRGDCEIIRESSQDSYLIMQITAATTMTFIITTYTFYKDNTYTRNQYTASLKSYSAGTGIAIDNNRKISCTIDTTILRVVNSLPEMPATGDENKIHLVKESTVEGDLFSEYLWVDGKWEKLGAFRPSVDLADYTNSQKVTYAQLKDLRDNAKLIPGCYYRITDYQCTTTQSNTKSAGHQFDIIVRADDVNVLNEECWAAQHEGDTYFANNNLSAWKLWYCIDNDTTRFAWADSANGKGVIYRMIDEWNNDVPYDFKNIQFKYPNNSGTHPYYYTFASSNAEANTDCSLSISNKCYSNTITRYITDGIRRLNYIIFLGAGCYSNTFENDCHDNTLWAGCNSNIFGVGCTGNTLGNYCVEDTLGDRCNYNTFGDYCRANTLGKDNSFNTFGNTCNVNTLENSCNNNTLGNYCYGNTFGNGCAYIQFSADISDETKYNFYQSNHFGNTCKYILFTGAETASDAAQVQNYNFAQGLRGTYSERIIINGVRNRAYETKVAKSSNGEVKVYCEADLIQ